MTKPCGKIRNKRPGGAKSQDAFKYVLKSKIGFFFLGKKNVFLEKIYY